MYQRARRGALFIAAGSLGGAGITAITAGWDRWSYCWALGSYSCHDAQNDPPRPGVVGPWYHHAEIVSWLLLAVAFFAFAVAVWRRGKLAALLLAVAGVGALIAASMEFSLVVDWWPGYEPILEYMAMPFVSGLYGLAPVLLFAQLQDDGDRSEAWTPLLIGLGVLFLAAPIIEFTVLFDDTHDSPTLSGIYRGLVCLVTAALSLVAYKRFRQEHPDRCGERQAVVGVGSPGRS